MKNILITFAAILLLAPASRAQWTNWQSAEFEIGQPDFTTATPARSATGMCSPYSVAIDLQHSKIYVGDVGNNCILRFAYPITGNQPTAELVFGQPNFTSDSAQDYYMRWGWWPNPTARQILGPSAMVVYNGDLWVLDNDNNRVVRFSQAYSIAGNNPSADLVIGQTTFTTNSSACTRNSFYGPLGMTIDGNGNLWVADAGNGRILLFNNASGLSDGADASSVLGQADFITGTVTSSPTQSQFCSPSSICFDGTTLWVCDKQFNRIMRFDSAATKPYGANADAVLGQSDFISSTTGTTMSTFNRPFGVCADGKGNLYVTDQSNSRTLIFLNAAAKSNGANADNVLQEESYNAANLAVDNPNGKLFIADPMDCRVVEFAASGALLTDVEHNETPAFSGVPKQFRLSNYPNPFNPSTTISLFIPYRSSVVVEVFDLFGRTIRTLMKKEMSPGSCDVKFDGTSLPSGVYYCRLKAGSVVQTRKLVLLK